MTLYGNGTVEPQMFVGVGGNYYVVSSEKFELFEVCDKIGKSRIAIYFNKKYSCWTIRVKDNTHKQRLLNHFGDECKLAEQTVS